VIIFTVIASDISTKLTAVLLSLGVLLLDLFVMLAARPLLRWAGAPLLILGSVLAIIQTAIGVQINKCGRAKAGNMRTVGRIRLVLFLC
jgi:hypothetical protein